MSVRIGTATTTVRNPVSTAARRRFTAMPCRRVSVAASPDISRRHASISTGSRSVAHGVENQALRARRTRPSSSMPITPPNT